MKSFLLFVDDGAVSFAVLCKIDRDKKQLCAGVMVCGGEKKVGENYFIFSYLIIRACSGSFILLLKLLRG